MGRKKARYENAGPGNIKTVYTVNFREPEEIIEIIQQFKEKTSRAEQSHTQDFL